MPVGDELAVVGAEVLVVPSQLAQAFDASQWVGLHVAKVGPFGDTSLRRSIMTFPARSLASIFARKSARESLTREGDDGAEGARRSGPLRSLRALLASQLEDVQTVVAVACQEQALVRDHAPDVDGRCVRRRAGPHPERDLLR